MSILFGVCQPEGDRVEERRLTELGQATARSAPDGTYVAARGRIGMGYQPYHTHLRSNLETQPSVDELGNMLTLDGRIDNYAELCELLDIEGLKIADSQIVSAAFRRWGSECFSKLIGDWALALWSHRERTLYLARDHAGTRTVYFEDTGNRILWSTSLEFFLATGDRRELDQAYAACYLSCRPICDLTPYMGIRAVTPGHYHVFHEKGVVRRPHWQWQVKDTIVYKSDAEYEEHFLSLFRQSVERRTGPGAPILAQLSGGMDSTSIVCMSDRVRTERGGTAEDLLDTVSYYDASEPNWDERPYFSAVEARRRKSGIHLSISAQERTFEPPSLEEDIAPCVPGIDGYALGRERQFEGAVAGREYRVILSGIGGDEVLGGVPDPLPELADHLVSLRLPELISKAMEFCLPDRRPLVHMLGRTVAYSINSYLRVDRAGAQVPPWVSPQLKQIADGYNSYPPSGNCRYGLSPSSINNGATWWLMLETLPHLYPSVLSRREYRYPYLDRDLVDFLYRIPRAQLVRPGRRRSLMRRALVGIVPTEVLERRRKASLIRGPLLSLRRGQSAIEALFLESSAEAMGLVDAECLKQTLAVINKGTTSKWWPAIISATNFEFWLAEKGMSWVAFHQGFLQGEPLHRKDGANRIRAGRAVL